MLVSLRAIAPLIPAALLLLTPALAAQGGNAPRAGSLIDTLEKGDVMHVADDNNGRMDLLSVLLAASHAKCEDVLSPGFAKLAVYIAYLGSDSVTRKYPSGEFLARGLISAAFSNDSQPGQESNANAPWLLNPNAAAMLALGARGCSNPRYQTVLTNLFKAIDHHIAWHDQNLGTRAPLMQQQVRPVRAADFRPSIEQDVELPAQPVATRQVTDLETRRATNLTASTVRCIPTAPARRSSTSGMRRYQCRAVSFSRSRASIRSRNLETSRSQMSCDPSGGAAADQRVATHGRGQRRPLHCRLCR